MDETDFILIKRLIVNTRVPYRQLADELGLSVNAVHKRIQSLKESGIINKFTAKIGGSAIDPVPIWVYGKSEAITLSEIHQKLGVHESIYWVSIAAGNYLYIGIDLQNISELGPCVAFVKKEAQLVDPIVSILQSGTSHTNHNRDTTLYPLDYQIIYSLRNNSRKALSNIAEELGVSAKTVRRRLTRMIDENLIELSLEWYPNKANDIMSIFHIHLRSSEDNSTALALLFNKYSSNVFWPLAFSNFPNQIACIVWSRTMAELKEFWECFEEEESVKTIVANILYTGQIFDTWKDEFLHTHGAPTQDTID